jgi:hypothetical protein
MASITTTAERERKMPQSLGDAHNHCKKVCGECKTVMGQCRCPSLNKRLIYDLCADCAAKARQKPAPKKRKTKKMARR